MASKQKTSGNNPNLEPNTCQTPNVILDHWMATLGDVELRLVMYAVRHTYGWQKKSDQISVSQFVDGVKKKNGEIVDRGTGKARSAVQRGLKSLVGKGILHKQEWKAEDGGDLPPSYSLNLQYLPPVKDEKSIPERSPEGGPHDEARGGSQNRPGGGLMMRPGGAASEGSGGPHDEAHKTQVSQNPTIQNPEDLPSVDPSAHETPARESGPVDSETGPTDRLTDRPTNEEPTTHTSKSLTSMQLLEAPEAHHENSDASDFSPKEDDDNASESAVDALRQQAEAIPAGEVSEEAQSVAREVLGGLPKLFPERHKRDRRRVGGLAEHYVRAGRTNVVRDAADGLTRQARKDSIGNPWGYLIACCVDVEKGYSEGDDELLASLSGEKTTSSLAESEPAGYEWFLGSDEQESDTGENEQRRHTPEADPEALAVWEKVLEDVSGEINAPSLRVWFEGTVPVSLLGDTLTISVPNSFAKEYIESRFLELLEGALVKRLSPTSASPRLEIVVGVEGYTHNTAKRRTSEQEPGDG